MAVEAPLGHVPPILLVPLDVLARQEELPAAVDTGQIDPALLLTGLTDHLALNLMVKAHRPITQRALGDKPVGLGFRVPQ